MGQIQTHKSQYAQQTPIGKAGSHPMSPPAVQKFVEVQLEEDRAQRSGQPKNKIKAYVVINDQSNRSLAKSKLFNMLDLEGEASPYMLKTCSQPRSRVLRQCL